LDLIKDFGYTKWRVIEEYFMRSLDKDEDPNYLLIELREKCVNGVVPGFKGKFREGI
jgi:hypothetical protein